MASASDQRHGVGDAVGDARAVSATGTSAWCSAASDTAPSSTEQTVMPSCAVASSRPVRCIASSATCGALAARVGQRLELAAPGRHRGELGADEEGVARAAAPR